MLYTKEKEQVEVFLTPPHDFQSKLHVASCYCSFKDKLLLVKRHPKKPQGETWGVPAGKIETGEDPKSAAIRETLEEVGLQVKNPVEITVLYVRWHQHLDYIFHMFYAEFLKLPKLSVSKEEHTEARWVTKKEALKLPLIVGGFIALDYFLKFRENQLTSKK